MSRTGPPAQGLKELWPLRSWADQAHIPAEHIPDLGQSIQAAFDGEPANPRDPRIIFSSPTWLRRRLRRPPPSYAT